MKRACVLFAIVLSSSWSVPLRANDEPGHSRHGSAFDTGLRQKPWKMEGIGSSHFAVTTRVPEVQQWFDQGNTLLHSFWFEEAERSFRWCVKLDPDCAMAYWGLARCGMNWFASRGSAADPELKRYRDFLKEAVRRKGSVTERERMYIEAWVEAFDLDTPKPSQALARKLQQISLAFPDDIEAKALYALYSIRPDGALGTEMVLREVLAEQPDHPGAHHYRIHNWDGVATEQGLPSCARYGPAAPNVGHANHMPGHNYTKVGMWHEAAISMDSATRVELRYMNERLALPFETWNFAHNRDYLCYIQEQLGMEQTARAGARSLIAAPRDPHPEDPEDKEGDETFEQGLGALVRGLVKFERWDTILEQGSIPWRGTPEDQSARAWVETLAHAGLGKPVDARARFDEFKTTLEELKKKDADAPMAWKAEQDIAEGLVCAAEGDVLGATRLLGAAAEVERRAREAREYENDPPLRAWPVYRLLGDVYAAHGEPHLAIEAYEQALKVERNDAFSLSGLACAHAALGDKAEAQRYANALAYVWSSADAGLRWRTSVDALQVVTQPIAVTPAPERRYEPAKLDALGPNVWSPFAAPKLDCLDADGVEVRLEDLRGKNVLLVFYLGKECVHCMEQLRAIDGRKKDWEEENAVVLAVSSASSENNKDFASPCVRLLSDKDHENARRFTSYDDFEEMELHSTILIDTKGRVHWKRTGGDPFQDVDFLVRELKRINEAEGKRAD